MAVEPAFDQEQWAESRAEEHGAGGRQVLGIALGDACGAVACVTAPGRRADRSAGQSLSSPAFAQWIAVAAGPLALLGLVWLMFGRTRRKEAERFTRSVVAMRTEAQSLEALLEVLSQRISDSRTELTMISQHLMQLGDEATGKLGGITREFDSSSERLKRHGEALDRAAESARNDIAVLLEDLPRAEQTARAWPSSCVRRQRIRQQGGRSSASRSATLAERTREADRLIARSDGSACRAACRNRKRRRRGSGTRRRGRIGFSGSLDRCSTAPQRRSTRSAPGIDAQAAAVAALVEQASAGIGKAGADASEALAANIDQANGSLEGLSNRVAEQDRASQRMIAEIDRGLALIDQRFTELAANGDERANHFLESLTRARAELDALAAAGRHAGRRHRLVAERTARLRESIDRLAAEIRDGVGTAIGEAQGGADRLVASARAIRPGNRLDPRCGRRSKRPDRPRPAARSPNSRTASLRCWRGRRRRRRLPSRSSPSWPR